MNTLEDILREIRTVVAAEAPDTTVPVPVWDLNVLLAEITRLRMQRLPDAQETPQQDDLMRLTRDGLHNFRTGDLVRILTRGGCDWFLVSKASPDGTENWTHWFSREDMERAEEGL